MNGTWDNEASTRRESPAAFNLMERTLRVLLVEDAPFLRYAFARLLRIEGFGPSVAYRVRQLKELFGPGDSTAEISGDRSKRLWQAIRDCEAFADGTGNPVWRVSVTPSEAHRLVLALRMEIAVDAFYDWAGGLVWLRMEGEPEAELLRRQIQKFGGGHASSAGLSEASAAGW